MLSKYDYQACKDLARRGTVGGLLYLVIWIIILIATPYLQDWPLISITTLLLLAGFGVLRALLGIYFDRIFATNPVLWLRAYKACVLALAVTWGFVTAISIWLYTSEWPAYLAGFATAGVVSGGVIALGSHLSLQRLYIIATIVPSLIACLAMGVRESLALATLFFLAFVYLMMIGRQLNKQYWHYRNLSDLDGLTGIPNRRQFNLVFQEELKRAIRGGYPLSLLMIDIDYFKKYNDLYGHQNGDQCLKMVARALESTLRRQSDLAARFGGEEFICVLPSCPADGAHTMAQQILDNIAKLAIPHGQSDIAPYLTVSVGAVTLMPGTVLSESELIKHADELLYQSKAEGRNRYNHRCV
jgi:diguanylate cyclase (GGDEF)-like protein